MPISLCFFIFKITKYRLAIICNYSNLKCRYNDLEIWVNSINRERLKRHLIKKYKISSLWLDIYNYTINKEKKEAYNGFVSNKKTKRVAKFWYVSFLFIHSIHITWSTKNCYCPRMLYI